MTLNFSGLTSARNLSVQPWPAAGPKKDLIRIQDAVRASFCDESTKQMLLEKLEVFCRFLDYTHNQASIAVTS